VIEYWSNERIDCFRGSWRELCREKRLTYLPQHRLVHQPTILGVGTYTGGNILGNFSPVKVVACHPSQRVGGSLVGTGQIYTRFLERLSQALLGLLWKHEDGRRMKFGAVATM
jgi:hypothetical protein